MTVAARMRGIHHASGVPTAKTPDQVPGLWGWWKGSALAGADGSTITTWPDSSGNGRDMTIAGGGTGPVKRAALIDGNHAAEFNPSATTDKMSVAAVTGQANPSDLVIFAVLKQTTAQNGAIVSTRNATLGWIFRSTATGSLYSNIKTGATSVTDTFTSTNWHLAQCIRLGLMAQLGHNGVLGTPATATVYPDASTDTVIGNEQVGGANPLKGFLAEVAIWPSMSSFDVECLELGYAAKYPSIGIA